MCLHHSNQSKNRTNCWKIMPPIGKSGQIKSKWSSRYYSERLFRWTTRFNIFVVLPSKSLSGTLNTNLHAKWLEDLCIITIRWCKTKVKSVEIFRAFFPNSVHNDNGSFILEPLINNCKIKGLISKNCK